MVENIGTFHLGVVVHAIVSFLLTNYPHSCPFNQWYWYSHLGQQLFYKNVSCLMPFMIPLPFIYLEGMVSKFKACMPGVVIEQHVKRPMCANFWSDWGNLWLSTAHIAIFARWHDVVILTQAPLWLYKKLNFIFFYVHIILEMKFCAISSLPYLSCNWFNLCCIVPNFRNAVLELCGLDMAYLTWL